MDQMNRREFAGVSLAALGAATLVGRTDAEEETTAKLPTVRWGEHEIARVLVGHNPIKGGSHFSSELNSDMREWFANREHGLELLRRCEQCGINAAQMGGKDIENLLRAHYAEGGSLKWIATFYSKPGTNEATEELARILKMDPKPIGAQQFGNVSDAFMRMGKPDRLKENLKMLRDAGLLVGLCSHNHQTIDYAEEHNWDVDFYQCCFYTSAFSLDPAKRGKETFEEQSRRAMVKTIQQVSKPCIAFKVLAANRHCHTAAGVERAIRFAFANIKPTDVVLLGMWQKYKDQVAENVGCARGSFA
ncbi:MAG: hypothetical protein H8E44_15015 [Planctomycetes bacterium]|nr:hypothetical protein [Planctomycetota bacterium]MBL7042749.1 hypothetical protein [Pirellulaceae bacterium]